MGENQAVPIEDRDDPVAVDPQVLDSPILVPDDAASMRQAQPSLRLGRDIIDPLPTRRREVESSVVRDRPQRVVRRVEEVSR
jgi:hypothetical protein